MKFDPIEKSRHYNVDPCGVECIEVVKFLPFCLGNAVKYLWRRDHKESHQIDSDKARYYLRSEKERWAAMRWARKLVAEILVRRSLLRIVDKLDSMERRGSKSVSVIGRNLRLFVVGSCSYEGLIEGIVQFNAKE